MAVKVIVAGGREVTDSSLVFDAIIEHVPGLSKGLGGVTIVSGMARGVDSLAVEAASCLGYIIKAFPADWEKYGRSAGPIRNKQMAVYADVLIAVWDGKSRGTLNMINQMKKLNKPHIIVSYNS